MKTYLKKNILAILIGFSLASILYQCLAILESVVTKIAILITGNI